MYLGNKAEGLKRFKSHVTECKPIGILIARNVPNLDADADQCRELDDFARCKNWENGQDRACTS